MHVRSLLWSSEDSEVRSVFPCCQNLILLATERKGSRTLLQGSMCCGTTI